MYNIIDSKKDESMFTAGIILITTALVFTVFCLIPRVSIKISGLVILCVLFCSTLWICANRPQMHKPLSVNVIEYLIKINSDGSMTTTKQTTTTVLGGQEE